MDAKILLPGIIIIISIGLLLGSANQSNGGIISLGKPSGCNYDGKCQGWEDITCPDCVLITTTAPTQTKPECNDKIDNDGDGWIDLDDSGCLKRGDRDESDCGDGVCEGSESCIYCPEDCGVCPTTTTITLTTTTPVTTTITNITTTTPVTTTTTIPSNSCTDTDGGIVSTVKGNVTGYYNGQPYSYTDYCLYANETGQIVLEYYCSGKIYSSTTLDCAAGIETISCVDGACV